MQEKKNTWQNSVSTYNENSQQIRNRREPDEGKPRKNL